MGSLLSKLLPQSMHGTFSCLVLYPVPMKKGNVNLLPSLKELLFIRHPHIMCADIHYIFFSTKSGSFDPSQASYLSMDIVWEAHKQFDSSLHIYLNLLGQDIFTVNNYQVSIEYASSCGFFTWFHAHWLAWPSIPSLKNILGFTLCIHASLSLMSISFFLPGPRQGGALTSLLYSCTCRFSNKHLVFLLYGKNGIRSGLNYTMTLLSNSPSPMSPSRLLKLSDSCATSYAPLPSS